ncbi:hypothetical protein V8E54_014730 [Elaphomyces granulatus]
MGTASTMNALAEALGMLPGSSAIPAPYRERAQCAYETGKQIGHYDSMVSRQGQWLFTTPTCREVKDLYIAHPVTASNYGT